MFKYCIFLILLSFNSISGFAQVENDPIQQLPKSWSFLKISEISPKAIEYLQLLKDEEPQIEAYFVKISADSSNWTSGNRFWSIAGLITVEKESCTAIARVHHNGDSPVAKDSKNILIYQYIQESENYEEQMIIEEQPKPAEGMMKFYQFIDRKLKYPKEARRAKIQGKVYVQFVVTKDGSIDEVQIIKGIGGGCDEEAMRVIQKSPKWIPGKQDGKPVNIRMILPITFRL